MLEHIMEQMNKTNDENKTTSTSTLGDCEASPTWYHSEPKLSPLSFYSQFDHLWKNLIRCPLG